MPDLEGKVSLEGSNYEGNWGFFEVDEDGHPNGFAVGMPPDATGWWVYASEVNGGPTTMAAQTTAPIDIDEDSHVFQHEWIEGHSPRNTSAVNLAPPPDFELRTIPQSQVGLPAGTYLVAYTWMDFYKQHTTLSPALSVTIASGQYIRVGLPTSPPEGGIALGLWLSEPNGSFSTMRLQAVIQYVQTIPTTYLLKGPYRRKRNAPEYNETLSFPPRTPTLLKTRGNGESVEGIYRARIYRVNPQSGAVSQPSEWSGPLELTQEDVQDHLHIVVDWQAWGDAMGKEEGTSVSYRIEVERTLDDETDTFTLTQQDSILSGRALNSLRDATPTFSGATVEEMERLPLPLSGGALSRAIDDFGLSYGEEGLEPPSSPLESALPSAPAQLAPGKYYFTIAYAVGDEITKAAEPQQITVTAGQAVRVWLPDQVNYFRNSQFRDVDAGMVLDGWTLTGATGTGPGDTTIGSFFFDTQGRLNLSTAGVKTTGATPDLSQTVRVNRETRYAIGGEVTVSLANGTVEITVEELSSTSSLLVTHTLKSISTAGVVKFEKVFGPNYTALNTDTTQLRFRIKFAGATRSGVVVIEELYFHAHTRRLRRRDLAALFSLQPDNANPKAIRRWAKMATRGIEAPPRNFSIFADPSPTAFNDNLNFETSLLNVGWSLRQSSTTGTVAALSSAAALEGSQGYRIEKNTATTRYVYLHRTYATNRANLSARMLCKMRTLPDSYASILQIKSAQADGEDNVLASIRVRADGRIQMLGVEPDYGAYFYTVATGLKNTDILDVELRVVGAHGTYKGARVEVWYAKNGTTPQLLLSNSWWHWEDVYAKTVQAGLCDYDDPSDLTQIDIDSVYVTESGFVPTSSLPPALTALPLPDRPTLDPVVEETVNFEGNAVPAPWFVNQVPASATTIAVQTAAAISGTYGLKVQDSSTAVSVAELYIGRTYSGSPTSKGVRARYRVVARPTVSGAVVKLLWFGHTSTALGWFEIDSVGDLYARTGKADGTFLARTRVAQGVTNGSILTLEMVAQNAGTSSGAMTYWVSVGGTGAVSERQLMWLDSGVDWSDIYPTNVRVGAFNESAITSTSNFDIDDIVVTTRGERVFEEFSDDQREINQLHVYYPPGQPLSNDLYLRDWRKAVTPGATYVAGIQHMHENVLGYTAQPYFFSAYDVDGQEHPLGGLLNNGAGGTGSQVWADHQREFTIPENCFEVRMTSKNIGSGEFACQSFMWGPLGRAQREVIYPASGSIYMVFNTDVPDKEDWLYIENEWLSAALLSTIPAGTTITQEWQASERVGLPTVWSSSPQNLIPAKYLHIQLTLEADSTLTETPTILPASPYIDLYSKLHGQQVASLLRDDLSEFSGGVYALTESVMFPRFLAEYDTRFARGRVKHHPRTDRIGALEGFDIRAFSEEAVTEIEENWTKDFVLEFRDRRAVIRLTAPPTFSSTEPVRRLGDGTFVGVFETNVDTVEVVSTAPMIGLA